MFIADTATNVIQEVVKATGDIITVAGNGTYGYSGDGGPATAAELYNPLASQSTPRAICSSPTRLNNVVREVVKATGDIITYAGNGKAGYSGNGGPATKAELDGPRDVVVDSAGDLFIADPNSNVVSEVTPAVTVTVSPSAHASATAAASASAVYSTSDQDVTLSAHGHQCGQDGR